MIRINVSNCLGCRKGVYPFIESDGKVCHLDLFATKEAGAYYQCHNYEQIKPYLIYDKKRVVLMPNEELKGFLENQDYWWEDIIDLAYVVFKTQNKVAEFFNKEMLSHSDVFIEEALLQKARLTDTEVNLDIYTDLKTKD